MMKHFKLKTIGLVCLVLLVQGFQPQGVGGQAMFKVQSICSVGGGLSNGARVVRGVTAQSIWLSFEEKREYIIEQIANRFPRIDKKDLKRLDELIEKDLIKVDISPLTVKKAMVYIKQLDKLNGQIFGVDFKPFKIKLNFAEVRNGSAKIDFTAGINKGILTINIPIRAKIDSRQFINEMFYIYLHEDGHIKTNLIKDSRGKYIKPYSNEYWFNAISEGKLDSPFLQLSDYGVDFRDYLRRKGGIFQVLDPGVWESRVRILKLIHETLNNKLLVLVFGKHYSQAYIDTYRSALRNLTLIPQSAEYELLHGKEGLEVKEGILFLLRNLERQISSRILGDEKLSAAFQTLADIIIAKINSPDFVKQNFRKEYHELVIDLLNLADALYINSLFLNELSSYTDDINELFSLLNSLP